MRVGGQLHAPAALPPGTETRYPLYRRLGGLQGRSARGREISPPPDFDPRTGQPVASHYTNYGIPAHLGWSNKLKVLQKHRILKLERKFITYKEIWNIIK